MEGGGASTSPGRRNPARRASLLVMRFCSSNSSVNVRLITVMGNERITTPDNCRNGAMRVRWSTHGGGLRFGEGGCSGMLTFAQSSLEWATGQPETPVHHDAGESRRAKGTKGRGGKRGPCRRSRQLCPPGFPGSSRHSPPWSLSSCTSTWRSLSNRTVRARRSA